MRRLVSAHTTNVKRKRFGGGSRMTRAQLPQLLEKTPRHTTEDTTAATVPLLGSTMKSLDTLYIVYSTLRWLRAARLHATEAKKRSRPIWIAADGTGEKNQILLLCTLTSVDTMVISAVVVVGTENKVALRFFRQKVDKAMRRIYPNFDPLPLPATPRMCPQMGSQGRATMTPPPNNPVVLCLF